MKTLWYTPSFPPSSQLRTNNHIGHYWLFCDIPAYIAYLQGAFSILSYYVTIVVLPFYKTYLPNTNSSLQHNTPSPPPPPRLFFLSFYSGLFFYLYCHIFYLILFSSEPYCLFCLDCSYFSHSAFAGSPCSLFQSASSRPIAKILVFLILAHFANFKAKIGQDGSKKRETYFIDVSYIPFYILTSKKPMPLYP
jgi:hypothetical protein